MDSMSDLCKRALIIIVDSNDPTTLISEAMEGVRQGIFIHNTFEPPEWDTTVTEYKGWKIVAGRFLEILYTLVDPTGKVRVKHWQPNTFGPHFKAFLENVIRLEAKYADKSSMIIYQLFTDKNETVKDGCLGLAVSEARERFPNSKDLARGFYTVHPVDESALTLVEHYFTNLASSQDDECVLLLGKMGAKSVQITRYDASNVKNNFSANAGFHEVNAGVGVSINNDLKNYTNLSVTFNGKTGEVSRDFLKKSVWFKNHGQMNTLLELRLDNNVTDYDIETRITKSYDFNFSAAAKVLGVVEASLKNDYESTIKSTRKFHVIF